MNITFNKNHPLNSHQNYYKDWEYLGSDLKYDYYYKNNQSYELLGGNILLSIVCSNEPSDYMSPDINFLKDLPPYETLNKLLKEKDIS